MPVKIVFSDIDGTFLTNDHHVTDKTEYAVNQLLNQNIPFVLVSARMPEAIYPITERLGISRTESKQLIDQYFETYPRVHAYMQESIARARELGYTQTICGRRCYLRDINSANATVRGFAERNAINAPIQGSAADIIKIAMVRIHRRLAAEGLRTKMILQVHDELNFSVPPDERDRVQQLVVEEMQAAIALRVPLIADCGWGTNWLEAH